MSYAQEPDRPTAVTALVCGRLDHPDEFAVIASLVEEARRDGRIGRVILSTWAEGQDDKAHVIEQVRALGWHVVRPPSPSPILGKVFPGNISYQKPTLRAALDYCDDEEWVLKLRTDGCLPSLLPFLERLKAPPFMGIEGRHFDDRVLLKKLLIPATWTMAPFYITDQVFLGVARDIHELTELVLPSGYLSANLAAEQLWYSTPFRSRSRLVSSMMSDLPWFEIAHELRRGTTDLARLNDQHWGAARFLALWLLLADEYFEFTAPPYGTAGPVSLEDVIGVGRQPGGDEKLPGLNFGETMSGFATSDCLRALIQGDAVESDSGRLLRDEIAYCKSRRSLLSIRTPAAWVD